MQNLTLPSEVEIFGDYKLKQTKRSGTIAQITDYAILMVVLVVIKRI